MAPHRSSRAPGGLIRRVLAFVLLASALKMFGVSNIASAWVLLGVLLAAPAIWMVLRVRNGLPALPWSRPATASSRERSGADGEPALQQTDL